MNMAKLTKAKRGKNRWIGLEVDRKIDSREILEEIMSGAMIGIEWRLFDMKNKALTALAIIKIPLEDSEEAKMRINSVEGVVTKTTSGKIRLVRERLGIKK